MNFPESFKETVVYGNLTWNVQEQCFQYPETITHSCTEEAVLKYKNDQQNSKDAELARDSQAVIASAEEEISWVDTALAQKE